MKLKPIVNQLSSYLPFYSSYFSDTTTISSVSFSNGTVTIVTDDSVSLEIGQYVFITDVVPLVTIQNLTVINENQLLIETSIDNGLTTTFDFKTQISRTPTGNIPKAYLRGFTDTQYNGSFSIVDVPNRFNVIVQLPFTPTTMPAIEGFIEKYAANNYDGYHAVSSVINDTTFTYEIDPTAIPITTNEGIVNYNIRISAAINIERVLKSYTAQNPSKYWLFACPDRIRVSKDRNIPNDSLTVFRLGQSLRQLLIEPFYLYVVVPTSTQLSAADAYDSLNDVLYSILKSLLLFNTPSQTAVNSLYTLCFDNMDVFEYNTSYLVGVYSFFGNSVLTYRDSFNYKTNAPFRDVDMTMNVEGKELTANINIDVNPQYNS